MTERELSKNLSSFSSAPHTLHKPLSDSLGLVEILNISQKKSFLQHTRWGEGRKTQREKRKTQRSHRVKKRQGHNLASRDAHLWAVPPRVCWAVPPRVCSTWVISRHIFLTLRFGTDKTSPPISRATQQAVPEAIYYHYCNCYWYVIRKALQQPQTREWTPWSSRSHFEHWHGKTSLKMQQKQICWSEE